MDAIDEQLRRSLITSGNAMIIELTYRIGETPYNHMNLERMNRIELNALRIELSGLLYDFLGVDKDE